MYFVRLAPSFGIPLVVRYYPQYEQSRFVYRFKDQVWPRPHLCLALWWRVDYRKFSNLVDVFIFLTQCMSLPPKNLKNVFEIGHSNLKNMWFELKRPYASNRYDRAICEVLPSPSTPPAYFRRRRVGPDGAKAETI